MGAGHERRVVLERRLPLDQLHAAAAAVRRGDPLDHLPHELSESLAIGRLQRPQRRPCACAGGDHVLDPAGLQHADVQRHRVQRVDPPGDLRVQRGHHLCEREHRIAAPVWIGAVGGLPLDRDLHRVARRVHRPAIKRHLSPWQLRVHVRREHRHRCERGELCPRQLLCARRVGLLAGLKHGQQPRRQLLAEGVCGPRQRHQRRHVHVVPARVHRLLRRRERRPRTLAQRQAVELASHRHRRPVRGADAGDPARTGRRRAVHRQLLRDRGRRPLLLVGELGVGVQLVAQLDRPG